MKKIVVLFLVAAAAIAAVCYFRVPRPVVSDPENTVIESIVIERAYYYQKEDDDSFVWTPETPEDQALAREIVDYLSQCQERRTLRTSLGDYPLPWKCMYILLENEPPNSTNKRERGIVLGPSTLEYPEEEESYLKAVNVSYDSQHSPGQFWTKFQGRLLDPEGMRAYILQALGLPADFM